MTQPATRHRRHAPDGKSRSGETLTGRPVTFTIPVDVCRAAGLTPASVSKLYLRNAKTHTRTSRVRGNVTFYIHYVRARLCEPLRLRSTMKAWRDDYADLRVDMNCVVRRMRSAVIEGHLSRRLKTNCAITITSGGTPRNT